MTKEKQIIAIAELDGYKVKPNLSSLDRYANPFWVSKDNWKSYTDNLPYLTSRDAIIPVIERQDWTTKVTIVGLICCLSSSDAATEHSPRVATMLATPSQLAEALLRATGKWGGICTN